jgi:hypothetical protein
MVNRGYINPFATKFLKPIISQSQKMLLLRYECEDGSMRSIGIKEEAVETLHSAILEALDVASGQSDGDRSS